MKQCTHFVQGKLICTCPQPLKPNEYRVENGNCYIMRVGHPDLIQFHCCFLEIDAEGIHRVAKDEGHFPDMMAVQLPSGPPPVVKKPRKKPNISKRVRAVMEIIRPSSLPSPFEHHLLGSPVKVYFMCGPTKEPDVRDIFTELNISWPSNFRPYDFGKRGGTQEKATGGYIEFFWPQDPTIVPTYIANRVRIIAENGKDYAGTPVAGNRVKVSSSYLALGMWAWNETHKSFTIVHPTTAPEDLDSTEVSS